MHRKRGNKYIQIGCHCAPHHLALDVGGGDGERHGPTNLSPCEKPLAPIG
jgi:hypothetical protein